MDVDPPADRRTVCLHHHTRCVDIEYNRQTVSSPVSEKSRFCLENSLAAELQLIKPSQGLAVTECPVPAPLEDLGTRPTETMGTLVLSE